MKVAVDERLAGLRPLEEVPYLAEGRLHALHVDAALRRFATAMLAEAAGRLTLHHAVERRVALVAPHDAVDVVVAARAPR